MWWWLAPDRGLCPPSGRLRRAKKVIVLEKSHKLGGNTDFAHGYMVTYSKWHQKLGIPDEREGAVKAFSERCDGEINEGLLPLGGLRHMRLL